MVPTEAVLVISPHVGRSRKLARARRALETDTIVVAEELEIEHLERLPELLCTPDGKARLVIAAGGDGTVGSVAGRLGRLTYLAAGGLRRPREDHIQVHPGSRWRHRRAGPVAALGDQRSGRRRAPGLTVRGPHPAEHRLDVLAVEDVSPPKMLRAGMFLLLGSTTRFPAFGPFKSNVSASAACILSGCPSTGSSMGISPGSSKRLPEPFA
jgi:hypothetical protein